MNKSNVSIAIAVMERVEAGERRLNMCSWVDCEPADQNAMTKEADLIDCGTAACFGGWLASSPEWFAQGGSNMEGMPLLDGFEGSHAVAKFLDTDVAYELCATDPSRGKNLYGKDVSEIGVEDVLDKLYELREER